MTTNTQDSSSIPVADLPVRVYSPESSVRRPLSLVAGIGRDLYTSRGLAWRLAVRDISAQYRQSILGILWAFILPLANTLVWMFLNTSGIVSVAETDIPYPVYVFTGSMLWAILTDSISAPLRKITESKSMLSKINFPREALIVSGIYETLFNGAIKIGLMLVAIIAMGVYPDWRLILFPFAIITLVLAGTAIGLFLTPIGLLYNDIGKSIPLFMQFFMYLTPVVFPMPQEGIAATVVRLNPTTPLILTARSWITGSEAEFMMGYIGYTALFFLLLLATLVMYRAAMPILVERMQA